MNDVATYTRSARNRFLGAAARLRRAHRRGDRGFRAVEAYRDAKEEQVGAEIHAVFALMYLLGWDGES